VVTNQSGVARGYFPESLVHDVHERMKRELAQAGAHLEAVYHCPHEKSDACDCRKPSPGMLHRAARELGLDLQRSFVVGGSLRRRRARLQRRRKGNIRENGLRSRRFHLALENLAQAARLDYR